MRRWRLDFKGRYCVGTSAVQPTPRSSGAPTAGHQARSGGTRYIFTSPGLASHRRSRLTSNVMPLMKSHLASALPLRQFARETISAGVDLHHFGTFDASNDKLDRPLWVSDNYAWALKYKKFGGAPRYTKLVTAHPFQIIDLNGVRLQPIAMQLQIFDHFEWNKRLAGYLTENGVVGLVYGGREIFLPEPSKVVKAMNSLRRASR